MKLDGIGIKCEWGREAFHLGIHLGVDAGHVWVRINRLSSVSLAIAAFSFLYFIWLGFFFFSFFLVAPVAHVVAVGAGIVVGYRVVMATLATITLGSQGEPAGFCFRFETFPTFPLERDFCFSLLVGGGGGGGGEFSFLFFLEFI